MLSSTTAHCPFYCPSCCPIRCPSCCPFRCPFSGHSGALLIPQASLCHCLLDLGLCLLGSSLDPHGTKLSDNIMQGPGFSCLPIPRLKLEPLLTNLLHDSVKLEALFF